MQKGNNLNSTYRCTTSMSKFMNECIHMHIDSHINKGFQ